jgi:LPS-assembly lipoprotein
MMNRRRASLAIALLLTAGLVSGCGFRPIYETSSDGRGVSADLAAITIPEADTRLGQLIRNDLLSSIRRAGKAESGRYRLILKTKLQQATSVETAAEGSVRKRVRLAVAFELVEIATGSPVYSGKTFSQASYDETGQSFSDARAETDAIERVAKDASLDIRSRLAAHFASG